MVDESAASARPTEKTVEPPIRGRVLVVEDHGDTLELYCEVLTLAGYSCLTATSSGAALQLATDERFDAVVMDIGLPRRVDGLSLARSLRALPAPATLIASGHSRLSGGRAGPALPPTRSSPRPARRRGG